MAIQLSAEPPKIVLLVERCSVYGRDVIRPVNGPAKLVAQIADTKTLTGRTIELARDLEFDVRELHGRSIWPD